MRQPYSLYLVFLSCLLTLFACKKKEADKKNSPNYAVQEGRIEAHQNAVIRLKDGNFLFCGIHNTNEVFLLKTNIEGGIIWQKILDSFNTNVIPAVTESSTGELYVGGSDLLITGYHLTKTAANGDILWDRNYPSYDNQGIFQLICPTSNNQVVLCGLVVHNGENRNFIVRVDQSGDTVWTREFSVSSNNQMQHVFETKNKDILITGFASSFTSSNYFLRIEPNGNKRALIPFSSSSAFYFATIEKSDGTLVCCGNLSQSFVPQVALGVFKMSDPATISDSKEFELGYDMISENAVDICETNDGNLLLTGYSFDNINGTQDILVIKTNTEGQKIWYRSFGGTSSSEFACRGFAQNSEYVISGTKTDQTSGGWKDHVFLFRMSSDGDFL